MPMVEWTRKVSWTSSSTNYPRLVHLTYEVRLAGTSFAPGTLQRKHLTSRYLFFDTLDLDSHSFGAAGSKVSHKQ